MVSLKVGRPKTAIAAALLTILCAVATALFLSLGITVLSEAGYGFSVDFIEGVFYAFIWCAVVVVGGILILRRRYILGGALALAFSILITISVWYLGMWGIIGGVLSLISREKVAEGILEVARRYGRLSIREVAAETGKTEADVELAIMKLQSKGQPIRFEAETRNVIYG